MKRHTLLLLIITVIALLAWADVRKSRPPDHQLLETFRYNPAEGACAPCGAPCRE